jgi:septal ring factor EnvC (AmiA/AmiB activator)
VLLGLVTLMVAALPVPSALAAPDPLAAAQAKITDAQVAADEAAVEFDAAQARAGELSDEIARAKAKIESLERKQAHLTQIARARAIRAYKDGFGGNLDALLDTGTDALDTARRAELLDRANARGDQAIRRLETTTEDLEAQQQALQSQLEDQRSTVRDLEARQDELQDALRSATAAADKLRAELERQRKANEYVRYLQQARAAAQARASTAAPDVPATPRAGQSVSTPSGGGASSSADGASSSNSGNGGAGPILGSGGWICPVQGPVSFTDTWGSPRGGGRIHKGVDMFAARGTPVVAVTGGSVWYQGDPAGGNAAYVDASDGNTYYYAHLNSYVGENRAVSAGELIGTVGNSGTSSAPTHLHFEIRIGGANGQRINPYPTVAAHC